MARSPKKPAVAPWVPMGGTARKYRNIKTGEIIPRSAYEKRYGILQGFNSFDARTKARRSTKQNIVAGYNITPARGRKAIRVVRTPLELKRALARPPWRNVAGGNKKFGIVILDEEMVEMGIYPRDMMPDRATIQILVLVNSTQYSDADQDSGIETILPPYVAVIDRAMPKFQAMFIPLMVGFASGLFFAPRDGDFRWLAITMSYLYGELSQAMAARLEEYKNRDYPLVLELFELQVARETSKLANPSRVP